VIGLDRFMASKWIFPAPKQKKEALGEKAFFEKLQRVKKIIFVQPFGFPLF
jgi:hypothetical protein